MASPIDFEVEIPVGRVNHKRASLNRIDSYLKGDSTRMGYFWKLGRTVGSCRRLEILVDRLKSYLNILYPKAVLTHHPYADPAGFAGLAPE
jgi:hypothetical protein